MPKKKPEICDCCWETVGMTHIDLPLGGNEHFGVGESCVVCESCAELPFREVISRLYDRIVGDQEAQDAT